jgi:hypothetical protein
VHVVNGEAEHLQQHHEIKEETVMIKNQQFGTLITRKIHPT